MALWLLTAELFALRKHAYLNTLRMLPPKNENFHLKNSGSFHISAQNIDCGYSLERSNEYTQSMFLSRNKKNNVYPCKPQFSLRKHAYSNILKTSPPKTESFQIFFIFLLKT